MTAKWKRMWRHTDNQEVSLEAATLQRKRNSSLVEWLRAEDLPGLKLSADTAGGRSLFETVRGRRAFQSARKDDRKDIWSGWKRVC